MDLKNIKPVVLGLGYVGLPLLLEIGKKYDVLGYDKNAQRVIDLTKKKDKTHEVTEKEFEKSWGTKFTTNLSDLKMYNFFIVTVPTPIDQHKRPDLLFLKKASKELGQVIRTGAIVVFESTVYPGLTEEVCVPILEKVSGLKLNKEFFVGYSPERINPGDRSRSISSICKITSGSNEQSAETINAFYESFLTGGTFKAKSIRVAEAAKVIENVQRDVNIALVNELSILFSKLSLDTKDVLDAAATKWNFLSFRPGLVGGHCIGVDPYYLTHKAQQVGYHAEIILAGRRINDYIPKFIADNIIIELNKRAIVPFKTKVLILGITFKENCPDIRNTKVIDLVKCLLDTNVMVEVYDPIASAKEVKQEFDLELIKKPKINYYGAVVCAVAHDNFLEVDPEEIRSFCVENGFIYDLKYILPKKFADLRL